MRRKGHGEKRADYKKGITGGKNDKREKGRRGLLCPLVCSKGPIDSGVMSLVLAGVQRDRSRAEGGQRGKGRTRI